MDIVGFYGKDTYMYIVEAKRICLAKIMAKMNDKQKCDIQFNVMYEVQSVVIMIIGYY